ncbi:MAG: MMPL family transporter [Bacteroidota bacterium]|nr:MMPL family transporter [Bacteroidota bacterium]
MAYIFSQLRPWLELVLRRAWLVLLIAAGVTVGSVYLASHLVIDPDFAHLLPESYPSVQAAERIRETLGAGEVSVDLAIESPSFAANRAFGEALLPKVDSLRDASTGERLFLRSELRRDTEFLRDNGLYFATDRELDDLESWLEELITEAKLEANPFYFSLDEDEESADHDDRASDLRQTYDEIVGREYLVNPDSTILVARFFVSGSATDVTYIERIYGLLEQLIRDTEPQVFHADMKTYLAGRLWRQRIEIRAITDDIGRSFGAGLLAVLFVVTGYFFYKALQVRGRQAFGAELLRAPLTAVVIGLPLLMSLTWTAGVGYLAFGTLNLLSSTLGLVLFGLGIDYGIHFYARYIEERGKGHDPHGAAERTFMSTGQAIAVGALTTAAALYILMVADFKGFSQFGFLAGTGILFALAAMLHVLPCVLILAERYGLLRFEVKKPVLAAVGGRIRGVRVSLVTSVGATLLALVLAPGVEFEYRFAELEPEYEDWIPINAKVASAWSDFHRRNPAYIVVDDPAEAPAVAAVLRRRLASDTTKKVVDADTFRSTVRVIETLQERFAMDEPAARARLARLAYIRDTLLADPILSLESDPDLARLSRAAQTRTRIAIEDVPELLRRRFTSKTGELGNFITIIPAVGLSDGRKSMAFARQVGSVTTPDGKTHHAGSSSIVAADVLRLMRQESPFMVVATLIVVWLLMWVNFVRLRWSILAMTPLVIGVIWMILFMELFEMRLNFYNLVVIPAIIGIGNDAGAHLVHRYREEGRLKMRGVLRSTGEHVSIGALTTMVGFGGLLLSFHPGLNTVGSLAIAGIGATILAALILLPALIQWLEDVGRLWNSEN